MSYLPNLSESEQQRLFTETFYGYDANMKIPDGAWNDEKNLSTCAYPLFAPRAPRAVYRDGDGYQGILAKDALAIVKDGKLIYNDLEIEGVELTPGDKQMVSMGAYLCIFPDGYYFNTANESDRGYMTAKYHPESVNVTMRMCMFDGTAFTIDYVQGTAPENPENGQYWMDTGGKDHVLKVWNATQEEWIQQTSTYVKISAVNLNDMFRQNDGVTISGLTYPGTDPYVAEQVRKLNTDCIIQGLGEEGEGMGYIIVPGILDRIVEGSMAIVVERKMPKLDYVCELDNRLWGCRYGMDGDQFVNTIYASALGDCKNWYRYEGISTDSYAVSVGSDGVFTGICAYGGYVLAFKENCIHKIYGTLPANYTVSTQNSRGVQKGSDRSLKIVNERLYYKSVTDVCMYDGSQPQSIGDVFAGERFNTAVGGVLGGRYYICMTGARGREMWCYDAEKGIWHNEGTANARMMTTFDTDLLYMDTTGIVSVTGNGTKEDDVEWYAQSGLIGYEYPDQKYISRFDFRMKLDVGAMLRVLVKYDSMGEWEEQMTIIGSTGTTRTFNVPVIPRRCDHMHIRLEGRGECRIYSIAKVLELGSNRW